MLIFTHVAKYLFLINTSRQFKSKYDLKTFYRRPRVFNGKIMPKDKTVSSELKEIRIKAKNAILSKPSFPPSEIYLCVLGNGAESSCRALFLVTDQRRYLFNCGEGTQRLSNEYRMKLAKLDHIFFTYKSWENLGGLLGLSLTVQDIGVPEINIHGPPGIEMLFKNSEAFVIKKDLNVVIQSCAEKPFVDNCMEVQYIPIFTQNPETTAISSSDQEVETDENVHERRSKKPRLSPRKLPDVAMSYACKGHSKPGHLLIAKCLEQGVPPGPLLGDLKNGKDVTLSSGKIVHSKDVVSEEQPCPLFLVVECPKISFLDSFVSEEKFKQFQASAEVLSNIACVVIHFTPPAILKNLKYQEWMAKFHESTQHLILNNENSSLSSVGVHRIQFMLNLLHPKIFSVLEEHEGEESIEKCGSVKNIVQAKTLDRYYLRPDRGLDRTNAVCMNPNEFIDEAMNMPDFQKNLEKLHSCIKQISDSSSEVSSIYPEVTFLGTGSSIPSKVRNVSAILMNISKNEYFLMDCGEGTFGQIKRLYNNLCAEVLLQLSFVFISHMHADHHLGLIQLLKQRQAAYKKYDLQHVPLLIIGPDLLKYWLIKYHKTFESISSLYRFFSCSSFQSNAFKDNFDFPKSFKNLKICIVPVNHCPDAHGIVVEDRISNWKLVYSGDTLPCQNLIDAGKNCSVLIHEATMEDELADEALIKKHSTTSEAINIGAEMNAKYTILTHFSQRYAKVPVFSENFHNHVGCAFDNMKVGPKDLQILPLLIPILKCLFADNIEELVIKGNKRRKKLELIQNVTESVAV